MSDLDLVPALWVGYPAELPDRSALVPGETVLEIPREEAEASDNWRIVNGLPPAPPFEGYDDAAAADIVAALAETALEDVQAVAAYEAATKKRKTILDAAAARVTELEAGS